MPQRWTAELDRAACLSLVASRSYGRLVFTHRALPRVLPVTYVLDGGAVLIRLAVGSIAARATQEAIVAFEVDDFDDQTMTGWSVTIVGLAHPLTDPADHRLLAAEDLRAWGSTTPGRLFSVAAEKVTGQQLVTSAAQAQGVQSIIEGPPQPDGAAA